MKNNHPFVSIIVPVYNAEKTIGECIESLLCQSYPGDRYEIIIVDNNSKDNTRQTIERYPVRYVLEDKIQSSYAARNTGIQTARGAIFAFTDSDCIADNDWILNLTKRWQGSSSVMGVAGAIVQPEPKTLIEKYQKGRYNQKHKLLKSKYPCAMTANVAYRKELFETIGLFNQDLVTGGDEDLTQRVQQAGYKILYKENAKVLHKHRSSLRALYKQAKRYTFGKVTRSNFCLDPTKGYEHPLLDFLKNVVRSILMIGYRIVTVIFKEDRAYYLAMPFIYVAESHAIFQGKRLGLKYIRNKEGVQCPHE